MAEKEAEKEKVWLLSTKDVEYLYGQTSDPQILLHSTNYKPYLIDDLIHQSDTSNLSLINFYSDFLNKFSTYTNSEAYPTSKSALIHKTEEIQLKLNENLKENNDWEKSSVYFDKIFRLSKDGDRNIFLARSFPNRFKDFKIKGIERSDYWLLCYMQTVANILEKNIQDIEFYGLLHRGDLRNKIENGTTYSIKPAIYWKSQEQEIIIYSYSHEEINDIYTNIIRNSDFFEGLKNGEKEHYFMLGKLHFSGINQRKQILQDIGITEKLEKEDLQFLLNSINSEELELEKQKRKFKQFLNIDIEEFLKR